MLVSCQEEIIPNRPFERTTDAIFSLSHELTQDVELLIIPGSDSKTGREGTPHPLLLPHECHRRLHGEHSRDLRRLKEPNARRQPPPKNIIFVSVYFQPVSKGPVSCKRISGVQLQTTYMSNAKPSSGLYGRRNPVENYSHAHCEKC